MPAAHSKAAAAKNASGAYRSACTPARDLNFTMQKAHLARVPMGIPRTLSHGGESKYHGNWYGNRLALTIYVNTKALLFSQSKSTALCEMP
jgi:hypothetical protein